MFPKQIVLIFLDLIFFLFFNLPITLKKILSGHNKNAKMFGFFKFQNLGFFNFIF